MSSEAGISSDELRMSAPISHFDLYRVVFELSSSDLLLQTCEPRSEVT